MRITTFLKNIFSTASDDSAFHDEIIDLACKELKNQRYWYNIKATDASIYKEKVVAFPDRGKAAFIVRQIDNISIWDKNSKQYNDEASKRKHIAKAFVDQLFRSKLDLEETEVDQITNAFLRSKKGGYDHLMDWPVKGMVNIIQKKYKDNTLPPLVAQALKNIRQEIAGTKHYVHQTPATKLVEQIDALLFKSTNGDEEKPVYFLGEDDFAVFANKLLSDLPADQKSQWNKLMTLCQKSSGATPSKKFIAESKLVVEELGIAGFKEMLISWFTFIVRLKEKIQTSQYYTQHIFIVTVNVECLKGYVWLCAEFADSELLQAIAAVADRCYRKIPGVGQTCSALGNACVYTLYKSPGLEGVGHLSRLKLRVKQTNTQTLIEKYLVAAANDRAISVDVIEDLAVDHHGLADGKIEVELESFTAEVSIEKVGKVNLKWRKQDGSTQIADPAVVKEKQAAELKKLKATCKAIEASLSTQRDRFDQKFRSTGKMTWEHFNQSYFEHGLVSFISHKLIWHFENAYETFNAIYFNGKWIDHAEQEYVPGEGYMVSLWHPALNTLTDVQQWRSFLIKKELQQPLKQAFREIYLLTDAEINTRTYSNRMAGHILKQHQFNSLAKARGWRYALQGAFDGGSDGTAQIPLTENDLVAEYWTSSVDAEGGINNTGIFNYVSTDQVRFKNSQTNKTIDLIDVPTVVFSEVMRDTDLFVGVASVGNDPTWRDNGGLPAYRDYWHSYSFGDLTEVAKGRKEILERLLPRLKIAKVARIEDKFLIVKGKKRTYKIHLGSTNILMEPNDQYLCIVPDRGPKTISENVFLPFEGDNGFSVILSKAFLLADDDKITDQTIISQINR